MIRVIVIGAGMAGILAGIKLKDAGDTDFVIYEKADRIGGTWRENTYPGLTCDVPSHSYTYSFAPHPDWSHVLPPGPEVQGYFELMTERYGIGPFIRFNEEITSCIFRDGRWHLEMASGLTDVADIVIAATGVLHHPRYPDIPGQDDFAGAIFHSARFDHAVTLDGARIGIIGNGSTGVQMVSALASRAAKLCHFQRTAQWVMPVENPAFTEAEKQAFRDDPALLKSVQNSEEIEALIDRFTTAIVEPDSPEMAEIEGYTLGNLEMSVQDPVLKEKLRPTYRAACKRLIFSPDYYQAIQHPNAELVTDGIERIEEKGVRLSTGDLVELDVIVLATGFHADQFMRPMNVCGRGGVALNDVWAKKPSAYLAVSIPDFPNFFMLNGPNGPVGNFSLIEIAEQQWHYIEQLMAEVKTGRAREVSASMQAFDTFNKARAEAAKKTVFATGCKSWYLDAEGVPATWPWTRKYFAECMRAPDLDAFDLVT